MKKGFLIIYFMSISFLFAACSLNSKDEINNEKTTEESVEEITSETASEEMTTEKTTEDITTETIEVKTDEELLEEAKLFIADYDMVEAWITLSKIQNKDIDGFADCTAEIREKCYDDSLLVKTDYFLETKADFEDFYSDSDIIQYYYGYYNESDMQAAYELYTTYLSEEFEFYDTDKETDYEEGATFEGCYYKDKFGNNEIFTLRMYVPDAIPEYSFSVCYLPDTPYRPKFDNIQELLEKNVEVLEESESIESEQ